MKRKTTIHITCLVGLLALTSFAQSQPPEERNGPPRFQLGQLIPPPLKAELKLTAEQEKELEALQNNVREQLNKLLSDEQKKAVENFRPRRTRGPDGAGGNDPQPPSKGAGRKPNDNELNQPVKVPDAGIQWFATLESGLNEAKRTGRPILFVSGTPHCAGVSGIW